jgi:hypothetical protein
MTHRTTETPVGNGIVGRVTLLWHRLHDVAVPLIAVCCPLEQPSAQQNGSALRTNPTIDSTITARTRRIVPHYTDVGFTPINSLWKSLTSIRPPTWRADPASVRRRLRKHDTCLTRPSPFRSEMHENRLGIIRAFHRE